MESFLFLNTLGNNELFGKKTNNNVFFFTTSAIVFF